MTFILVTPYEVLSMFLLAVFSYLHNSRKFNHNKNNNLYL